ncbi:hypothetical protein TKK_0006229 [Trichogramma kaykai]
MSRTKDNSAELGTKAPKEKLKGFTLEEVDDCNVIVDVLDSPRTTTSPEESPLVVTETEYHPMPDSPKDEEDRSSEDEDDDDDDRDEDDELKSVSSRRSIEAQMGSSRAVRRLKAFFRFQATRAPPPFCPRRDGAAL